MNSSEQPVSDIGQFEQEESPCDLPKLIESDNVNSDHA
jgi:hypothetical protein